MVFCGKLIDLYIQISDAPKVIDLSGGQPDLTPEWIVWMMRELEKRNLSDKVYLWSDDNLSNDYLLRYLSKDDLEYMRHYRMYGKVCCFKGFDEQSFGFNTQAAPALFPPGSKFSKATCHSVLTSTATPRSRHQKMTTLSAQ